MKKSKQILKRGQAIHPYHLSFLLLFFSLAWNQQNAMAGAPAGILGQGGDTEDVILSDSKTKDGVWVPDALLEMPTAPDFSSL